MPSDAQEAYIFTTLRYDDALQTCARNTAATGSPSSIYLLTQHHTRLRQAGDQVFNGQGQQVLQAAGLSTASHLEAVVRKAVQEENDRRTSVGDTEQHKHSACRVRLQCNAQGRLSISLAFIPTLPATSLYPPALAIDDSHTSSPSEWQVSLDGKATSASIGTRYKTNDRSAYDRARKDVGIASLSVKKEVLLCNDQGYIMDASITTPYFLREEGWVTPASRFGGQLGTTRSWALKESICIEGEVHRSSLTNGEVIWLSNAARGFFTAVVSTQ